MAQESQQSQLHGSINLQNSQHPPTIAVLNSNYSNPEDNYPLQQVPYSQAHPPANPSNSFLRSTASPLHLFQAESGTTGANAVSTPTELSVSNGSSYADCSIRVTNAPRATLTTRQMTNVHCNPNPPQPDMLENLLTRSTYNSQIHVNQEYSRIPVSSGPASQSASGAPGGPPGIRFVSGPSGQVSVPSYSSSGGTSAVATDPEKRQLIQQQLILLLHAHRCKPQEDGSGRLNQCTTPHCRTMRGVLQHMATCNEGKNCQKPHCASSRQIVSHWKNCSNRECPVCEPLRQSQHHQRSQVVRQQPSGPTQPPPVRPLEVNGIDSSPQPSGIQQPHLMAVPGRVSLGNPIATTASNRQVPAALVSQNAESPSINGMNNVAANCSSLDQTGWRKEVNMPKRNHVVRRIVRFIFPFPDPAAYNDPRMRNLIEYARKVEREMYSTATDMDHYFHLLAQKCYKIHRELEEKRKSRQSSMDTSSSVAPVATSSPGSSRFNQSLSALSTQLALSAPTSSTSIDHKTIAPGTINGNVGSTSDSFEMGSFSSVDAGSSENDMSRFEHYLQNAYSRGRFKSETCNADSGVTNSGACLVSPSVTIPSTPVNSCADAPLDQVDPATSGLQEPIVTKNEDPIVVPVSVPEDTFTVTSLPSSVSNLSLTVKPDESKWKRWSREELLRHFLQLLEEIFNDKYAEPFRAPVDPVILHIPDYFQVIKEPMDLTTIRNNLEDGKYGDPWEVVEHFRLMFNNAWLYNKKTSKVYKMCTKLAELFQSRIDQVMQAMGFCCGQDFEYQPQGLYCASANMCTISRDAVYYVYMNNDKQSSGLICDKYYQCEKCFADAGDVIFLSDEPNQSIPISKEHFEKRKNNIKEKEESVTCNECGRRWHKVCALHMNEIWPTGFVCPGCLKDRGLKRKENRFTAKKLPVTRLSAFLEKRVNDFLKKKEVGTGEVTIRVLASSDKTVEVKPLMRARFTESGELSESFPYRLKAIFAFQEIDGQDVCFFGLYVQEYGSDSPQPNRRRVYVAYLDSVFFFRPKQYRTDVYHEILVGYLLYAKRCGYTMAHIWACPPGDGDDYIFHMHPAEQRIPKAKRLQEWYRRMLQKAIIEGIVVDYTNILKDALDHQLVSPTEIPYFDGDFWPNTLEDILKELEEEEARRRREEALAQAEAEEDESDFVGASGDGSSGDPDRRGGKKKVKKRKGNKKGNSSTSSKRKRLDGPIDGVEELSRKVYDTMEKLKEIFFVIRLHRHNSAASLPPTSDPDQPVHSELMDSRDAFLQMSRERHLEFSSLRRAKFSTMVLLYELHMELRQSFMYNCNVCGAQIDTRWHCNDCEEYDLCSRCYKTENHPHPMVKYGFGIDEDSGGSEDTADRPSGAPSTVDRRSSIERCIKSLLHACQCRDANCRMQTCTQMKRVLCHTISCVKKNTSSCLLCRQLLSLLWHHARCCEESKCPVPFCLNIKYRVKQKQLQQRLQQNKLLRRRISTMNRGSAPTSEHSSVHPHTATISAVSSTASMSSVEGNHSHQTSPFNSASFSGIQDSHLVNVCESLNSQHTPQAPHTSQTSVLSSLNDIHNQQIQRAPQNVTVTQPGTTSVSRPISASPSVPSGSRMAVQSAQSATGAQPQAAVSINTTGPAGSWRGRSALTTSVTTGIYQTANLQPITSVQNLTQPSTSNHAPSTTGSQQNSQKASAIAAMAAKARPQDIAHVSQVIHLIKAQGTSSEEQNRQFIDWIKRHPEYHAAFFALHSQNKQQVGVRSQSVQRRTNVTINPSAVSSTVVPPDTSLLSTNTMSSSVVIVNPSTNTTVSSAVHSLMNSSPNLNTISAASVAAPLGSAQSTVVHQPVQWISIQPPTSANQPIMAASTLHPNQVGPNATTLRFRTLPGSTAVVQPQPQQVQHFYNSPSLGSSNSTFSNTSSGTGMFVSASGPNMLPVGPPQQVIGTTQRVTPVSAHGLTPLGRQASAPQAAIVHLRQQQPLSGQVTSVQPHIILTNANTPGQLQHPPQQLISASNGGRQVVAVMTHQGGLPPNADLNPGVLDPNNSVGGLNSGLK